MSRVTNSIGPIVLLAIGVFAAAYSLRNYGLWVDGEPGPGLFPFIAGVLVFVPGLIILFTETRAREVEVDLAESQLAVGRLMVFAAVITAWPYLLEPLGYALASGLALLTLLRAGGVSWGLTVVIAVAAVGGSFLLFQRILEVPLPTGSWS
jgi:cell division protein FtsW (lipid II flippase)